MDILMLMEWLCRVHLLLFLTKLLFTKFVYDVCLSSKMMVL